MEDLEKKLMVKNMVALKFVGIGLGCSLQPDPDKPNKLKCSRLLGKRISQMGACYCCMTKLLDDRICFAIQHQLHLPDGSL